MLHASVVQIPRHCIELMVIITMTMTMAEEKYQNIITTSTCGKTLFKAFEERTIRELRQDRPKLKLSQEEDMILWK
jgi:hypothetical protein